MSNLHKIKLDQHFEINLDHLIESLKSKERIISTEVINNVLFVFTETLISTPKINLLVEELKTRQNK